MTKRQYADKENLYSFVGLTPLPAPVPPMLGKAIGYNGEARFVSFHWTPGGDEADYDDGQRAGTGEWEGYLMFVGHPTVYPHLTQYNLGDSDSEAQHALILDRQERALYVASIKDAETFLAQQWPSAKPAMTQQEYFALLLNEDLKNMPQLDGIDMKEINCLIAEQDVLVEALQNWLNKFLPN